VTVELLELATDVVGANVTPPPSQAVTAAASRLTVNRALMFIFTITPCLDFFTVDSSCRIG
jgi:hypothetical protein